MLTSTLCTVLLFARTAIASGTLAKRQFIRTRDEDTELVQMTRDELEGLRDVRIVKRLSDGRLSEFYPVADVQEPVVQTALLIWTTFLKRRRAGEKPIGERRFIPAKHIAVTQREVDEEFDRPGVWLRHVKDGNNAWLQLLLVREIGKNLYEWEHITIADTVHDFEGNPNKCDGYRFVIDGIGEKHLSEISSLFAQQVIHHLQTEIAEAISKKSYGFAKWIVFLAEQLQRVQKNHDASIRRLELDLVEHQESDGRVAIQREHQDGIFREGIDLRAAVTKECTRWQSEVGRSQAENAETKREHQEHIRRINQQKADELIREKDRADAERARLSKQTEDRKKEWDEMTESMKGQSEQLIQKQRESQIALEKQNDDLRRQLAESEGKLERANEDHSVLVHENNELKHLKPRFDDVVAEKDTVKAHYKELQEKMEKFEEEKRKLEATNLGLQTDNRSLRDEKEELKDREKDLKAQNAEIQRELDSERSLQDAQLDEQHQAAVDAEQKLREKEEGIDHWIMIFMFIGGGMLVVIGFIIFQLARRTFNEMYDHMEYELNAQLKRVKEPHPLVPGYPSAHANRLGVHEHPAVRDVFGMKEPWDVTPGEGFHVSRITSGGDTPGTSPGEVDDETTGVPVMEGMSEGDVMEHDKKQMAESAENFDI